MGSVHEYRGTPNQASIQALLSEFRVVVPQPPRCVMSTSEIRISDAKIMFSASTAPELGYTPYVQMLISKDASKMVLQASPQTEFSIPFYQPPQDGNGGRYKAISVGNSPLVKVIRKTLGWNEKGTYCSPGISHPEGGILFFDLSQAQIRGKKRRQATPEEIFASYPTIAEIHSSFRLLLPSGSMSDEIPGMTAAVSPIIIQ